jgi:hypothetical protein
MFDKKTLKEKFVKLGTSLRAWFFSLKKNPKKMLWLLLILVVLLGGVYLAKRLFFKSEPKTVYEAAVLVRDQNSSDPNDDNSNSLRAGDVLLLKQSGLQWSDTERVSYLILKMELTQSQHEKLTQTVDRELTKEEKEAELARFRERGGEQEMSEEERQRMEDEFTKELDVRRETVQARAYRIDFDKFSAFSPDDLIKGQPFYEAVYDWGVVEKRK